MKIMFLGDIFGTPGRKVIKENLKNLRRKYRVDFVVANCENAALNGKSMRLEDYQELSTAGIDYFTMGNHTFYGDENNLYFKEISNLVRPANYGDQKNGVGHLIFNFKGKRILLFNLLGTTFINLELQNPFDVADQILKSNDYDLAILDFHAEATSEKLVLANYLKERINIFVGTHTHVQTADERIIGQHTAYITDLGMCGVFNSAIGMDFALVTNRMRGLKAKNFRESDDKGLKVISGAIIKISLKNPDKIQIKKIQHRI